MNTRLDRRWHHDQRDAARLQRPVKAKNRRTRVRLRQRGQLRRERDAPPDDVRQEESSSGEVLEIGTKEEPSRAVGTLTADIDALVARPKPAGQDKLRGWP